MIHYDSVSHGDGHNTDEFAWFLISLMGLQ
jgi:hypothetical protein